MNTSFPIPTPPATFNAPVKVLVALVVDVNDKSVCVALPALREPLIVAFPPTNKFFAIPLPPSIIRTPDEVDVYCVVESKIRDDIIPVPYTSNVPPM
jgi:hypothetical protein